MERELFKRVEEVFLAALDAPESERAALVERLSAGDTVLLARVQSLLAGHEGSQGFLDPPRRAAEELPLSSVGPFRVVRVIGAGGTGTVYEAEQELPQRRVALKVLRSGAATRGAMRRFEAEAQVLGALRHPSIAQVYQAGVHDAAGVSIPYFAMELVPGARTICEFAASHALTIEARLRLFSNACDAVAHAHQRGVIHRDLKPGNILVDEAGSVKVIDFGLARVLGEDRTNTVRTDAGQIMGTLSYMSPEHCEGRPSLIDTRSDVYCLGVVLFELLCSRTPYQLADEPFTSAIQIIRDRAPLRPSSIVPALRGDLETLLLNALEKNPARRYQSVQDFARDISRFLAREPIEARPPSVVHQLHLFARRNRALVAGAMVAALALVCATVVSTYFAVQARQRAKESELAKAQALGESARRARAAEFMLGALSSVNPFLPTEITKEIRENAIDPWAEWSLSPWPFAGFGGNAATARDVLVRAAHRLESTFADDPLTRAELSEYIGWTLVRIEEYEEARPLVRFAAETRLAMQGPDNPDTIRACLRLAEFCDYAGPMLDSTKYYRLALDSCDRVFGPFDPKSLRVHRMLAGNLMLIRSDIGLSVSMLEERLTRAEESGHGDDPAVLLHEAYASSVLVYYSTPEAAVGRADHALSRLRALLPADDIRLATAEHLVSQTYQHLDPKHPLVRPMLEHVAGVYSSYFGPDTMATLYIRNQLATHIKDLGKLDEARPLLTDLLSSFERLQGRWSDEASGMRQGLAGLEVAAGNYARAGAHAAVSINSAWMLGRRGGEGVLGFAYPYLAASFTRLDLDRSLLALTLEQIDMLKTRAVHGEIETLLGAMDRRTRLYLKLHRPDDARVSAAEARFFARVNGPWILPERAEQTENLAREAARATTQAGGA